MRTLSGEWILDDDVVGSMLVEHPIWILALYDADRSKMPRSIGGQFCPVIGGQPPQVCNDVPADPSN